MARSYRPAAPRKIRVAGQAGLAGLEMSIYLGQRGGYISPYDAFIARQLGQVLCGGPLTGEARVSEQYLLDLERETFLNLCGERRTQDRIQHMLKTGKPLRN